ncbi:hypothetical protein T11_16344 [Trichinella zimbabwensis]|uniref:Uncharacterized protein n=1 Tax=Trichinella zimbabwensis TaxID=268475 RepID=A0A0V1GQT0_9BILA|nr:hypothetical protein T11_16344 [Trichinella zimbabwensis]
MVEQDDTMLYESSSTRGGVRFQEAIGKGGVCNRYVRRYAFMATIQGKLKHPKLAILVLKNELCLCDGKNVCCELYEDDASGHVWNGMLQIWQDSSQVSLALINTSVSNSTVASSEESTASHCLTTWVARNGHTTLTCMPYEGVLNSTRQYTLRIWYFYKLCKTKNAKEFLAFLSLAVCCNVTECMTDRMPAFITATQFGQVV